MNTHIWTTYQKIYTYTLANIHRGGHMHSKTSVSTHRTHIYEAHTKWFTHICKHAEMHTCIHTHMSTFTHVLHTKRFMHKPAYTIHVYSHTHTHTCATHRNTFTHVPHTKIFSLSLSPSLSVSVSLSLSFSHTRRSTHSNNTRFNDRVMHFSSTTDRIYQVGDIQCWKHYWRSIQSQIFWTKGEVPLDDSQFRKYHDPGQRGSSLIDCGEMNSACRKWEMPNAHLFLMLLHHRTQWDKWSGWGEAPCRNVS